jgi:hypothetical protein
MGVMVGEAVFNYYFADYGQSFEYNMTASRVYAKTSLTAAYFLPQPRSGFGVYITGYKRKTPDGSIEEVKILTNAVYDDNMTNIKYNYSAFNIDQVWVMIILEYWS